MDLSMSILPGLTGWGVVVLLMLGAMAGFLSGLLGIGGGMFVTPFLVFIFEWQGMGAHFQTKAAITTALMMMVISTFSSAYSHYRHHNIIFSAIWPMLPGMFLGSIIAGWVFNRLNGVWLTFIFSFFVMYSAYGMWKKKVAAPSSAMGKVKLPAQWVLLVVSAGICFVSGLVGAGGAFLMVPFFVFCSMDMHKAIGTASALTFPVAVFNTLTNMVAYLQLSDTVVNTHPGMLGNVFVSAFLCLVIPASLMAPVGVKLNKNAPVARLKRYFALLLGLIALLMFFKGLRSL